MRKIRLYTNIMALITLFLMFFLMGVALIKTQNILDKAISMFLGILAGLIIMFITWYLGQKRK